MLGEAATTALLLRNALAASGWSAEKLRAHQLRRLRAQLGHAYERVPLYRALYDEAGFDPASVHSLDDLSRVPVLTKERLRSAGPDETLARGVDPSDCSIVRTSGSTGSPLSIHLSAHDRAWQRAVAWRVLFEHGFRIWDRTLEIRKTFGPSFRVQQLGIAPKDWVSILEPPERWARLLAKRRHAVVVAGAGTLRALAEAVTELGLEPPRPRIVLSDSETLDPRSRARISAGLGTEPVDVYGLVELSNFAWECAQRRGLHVSADSHIVEVDAPRGKPGPLIATDLGMRAMPMIRYATGDVGQWALDECPCGRSLPRLSRVHGRAVDSVRLPGGGRLFWPFFHEALAAVGEVSQWRVIQREESEILVELVLEQSAARGADEICERVRLEIGAVIRGNVTVRVEQRARIPIEPGEKIRMVLSDL